MTVAVDERVEAHFPSMISTPGAARALLRRTLADWDLEATRDVAELLTDELVANVVNHVGSDMTLRIVRGEESVRVEVDDASRDAPRVREPSHEADHGRGLQLVEALAADWGFRRNHLGKTVWFELDVSRC